MHKNVEVLIGRLATDPQLRRRFALNASHRPGVLGGEGLELTSIELQALAATDPEALERFAAALDARLRRAPRRAEDGCEDPTSTPTAAQEETMR